MKLSHVSINRPVLTTVLSIFIVVLGMMALPFLGVREFPAVDPPRISVTTNYSGADAEVIESQITEPIEESVNGVEGIRTITSVSREGRSTVNVEFYLGQDMEAAANDVRDRVSRVIRRLPADADPPTVTKADANSFPILVMTVQSESRNILDVNAAAERIKEQLQTIPGVAEVRVWGEKRYAMRLQLDPERLAAHGLTLADVRRVLEQENTELPSGRIEGENTELTVKASGRLQTVEEFENLVLRNENGALVRLADVGTVRLGAQNERSILKRDRIPMIGLALVAQPGANNLAISGEFYNRFERLKAEAPPDLLLRVGFDGTRFIQRSLTELLQTIAIASGLVIIVLFAFLRSWRTVIIPAVAIPVSLTGSLFLLYLAGYTVNVLTMLGWVLAIGLVVDDAIVVLENIYKKIEKGERAKQAGYTGVEEVFFAVIATTISLVVVFLPLLFIPGFVGRLFREFGLAIAGSVVISSFISLTLTAMLCSRLLRHGNSRFYDRTEPFFEGMHRLYEKSLGGFLRVRSVALILLAASLFGGWAIFQALPRELAPMEDRGQFTIRAVGPEGVTYEYMDRFMDSLVAVVRENVPEMQSHLAVTSPGFGAAGGTNSGFMRVILSDRGERQRSQQQIIADLSREMRKLTDARVLIIPDQTIQGASRSSLSLEFIIQAPDFERLTEVLPRFLEAAQNDPAFTVVNENLRFTRPEVQVTVDRDRLRTAGVPFVEVGQALQLALGETRLGYFLREGRQYDVLGYVDDPFRNRPDDIRSIPVRTQQGNIIPLGNLINFTEQAGPPQLFRHNRWVSATISAGLAPGYAMADGIAAMQRIAADVLDPSFSTELGGEARDLEESSNTLLFAFMLALLLVYLVLAAQFESFRHPLVILFTVPLSLFGALLSLWIFGQSLNIFSQIGLIMLVGLVTKNGILIVEFSRQRMDQGMAVLDAVISAAGSRLRPILMTTLTSALGILPVVLALGAGAESRRPMGIAVVGGLMFGMVLTLYVIPAMIVMLSPKTPPPPRDVDEAETTAKAN